MVAIFTDMHFGIHGNSEDYFEVCDRFIDFFAGYVDEHGISNVVFAGDWFDSRNSINGRILYGATECLKRVAHACKRVDMLIGNHDTYERGSLRPNSVEMYDGFMDTVCVHSRPAERVLGGRKLLLVPWVVGGNAALDGDEYRTLSGGYDLMIGHFDFGAKFFQSSYATANNLSKIDPFKDELGFSGFVNRMMKPDGLVVTGHIHNRETKRCAGRDVVIAGSPYETASGFNTSCGFHVYDERTGRVEFVENPDYPRHVHVKASEMKDGRVDVKLLRGKIVSFELDCKCSMEDAAGFQSAITAAKPFSYTQNAFAIRLTDDDKKKIEEAGGNVTSKSKFDYVVDAIESMDQSVYGDGVTKEMLVGDARKYFDLAVEAVNKKRGAV